MKKEEKESLIEYMMKHCGFTYRNADGKFEKWASDRIKGGGNNHKRNVAENKEMTKDQMDTMIIYMHKQGFTNEWIAKSLGTYSFYIVRAIKDYEELVREKKS
jgi:hypothetical protein